MQLTTPKGLRLHIAIFGRTNVGKSSLLNCLTQQEVAIVSEQPGTTTDPVEKPMELLPIGPVLFIDTAGLNDLTSLGQLRIKKTLKVFDRAEVIILVTEPDVWTDYENFILEQAKQRNTPLLVVFNKIDIRPSDERIKDFLTQKNIPFIEVSSLKKDWETTNKIKRKLIEVIPPEIIFQPSIIPKELVKEDELVILVIPLDKEAPKGRIILPQQQILREILDRKANALVVNEKNLKKAINNLKVKPKLVITDSQAFEEVFKSTPTDILLTSFSILLANQKADIEEFIKGVYIIDELKENDKVLIVESCTHHPIGDDIGRKKIPRWLKERLKKNIAFEFLSGKDFPEELKDYKLIIHCGACMLNRKEMLSRVYKARSQKVAITNYGLVIAFLKGGLERVISPIRKIDGISN